MIRKFVILFLFSIFITLNESVKFDKKCNLPITIKKEIQSYKPIVNKFFETILSGSQQNQTYNELAKFTDTFGSRIAGSQNLENAIDYMKNLLKENKLENVHTENAEVPHWVRGEEYANLIYPRHKKLSILGLGGSVGTPPGGIVAEVLVVNSFEELQARASEAKDKIVVFNEDWISYGASVKYRQFAAARAAQLGAQATLVRSITPFSINSPHTGWQDYDDKVPKIPTACITVEDAQMFRRMSERGDKLIIHLYMEAQNFPNAISRNTIAEIKGSKYPDQVVLVSGHLDSWDVGQGAMDDGGGAFISWRALAVLRKLKLRPKRTLRVVLWTGEEEGLWGAQAYFKGHHDELNKFSIVMESDIGTFRPLGLTFSGKNETAQCIVQEVLNLVASRNMSQLDITNEGPDISYWESAGIPGSSLINDNGKYFYFHHSDGDTMTVEDPHLLDLCTAFWMSMAYVFADLKDPIPR